MPPAPGLRGSTIRQVVRVSLGGHQLRVRFSNLFGDGAVTILAARIAQSRGVGAIAPETERTLTFNGRAGLTIPAGGDVLSDSVSFDVAPLTDVTITVAVGDAPNGVTGHPGSRTTSYLRAGSEVSAPSMTDDVRTDHWYLLAAIDVVHPRGAAVVVLGNSIADGRGSATNLQNRWPDNLARRLHGEPTTAAVAVINSGIGGNCVVRVCLGPPGIERLDRDALLQPNARWLIVSEGVNDIGGTRTAESANAIADSLIAAYKQIITRAHARGVRVYGATILPFAGNSYDSPDRERARQTVNAWIRTSGAFDAVIDFDLTMRDPTSPTRLRPDVDGGDHLHPNEHGYRVMADAIDLRLFKR